jgi:hypothetical protein
MKINIPLLLLLAVICHSALAQDKIITTKNDTINCKIRKVTGKAIFFDLMVNGLKTSGDIPRSSVSNYTIYSQPQDPPMKQTLRTEPALQFQRWRLGLAGGLGYLIASSKDAEKELVNRGFSKNEAKSYYNGLRLGYLGAADLTYLFPSGYGAGLKYKLFNNSNSQSGFFDPKDGVTLIYSKISENIYVNYLGASFYAQQWMDRSQQLKLNSSYSLGMAMYRNETEVTGYAMLIKGNSLAMDASLGIEYFLSPHISLGIDLSAFYSTLRKVKASDGTNSQTYDLDKDNYENLSRIDLSFGIKIYR